MPTGTNRKYAANAVMVPRITIKIRQLETRETSASGRRAALVFDMSDLRYLRATTAE